MAKKGPEHERTRIPTLKALIKAGWNRKQIICPSADSADTEWRVPKTPSEATKREMGRSFDYFPVDIAIFDSIEHAGEYDHLFGIIECKKPDVEAGVTQLETYMGLEPRCRFGFWTNSEDTALVYKLADGTYEVAKGASLPKPSDNLRRAGKEPLTYNDLDTPNAAQLSMLFLRLLDTIAASDSVATRPEQRLNEIASLLIVKLESDKRGISHKDEPLTFQIRETVEATAAAINELYQDYKSLRPELFLTDDADVIRLNDWTIHWAVSEMQGFNFNKSSHTAFSKAFQIFRTANLKIGDGQYFTHHRVIEAGIRMLCIDDRDKVIDPACGTGGFLYKAYEATSKCYGDDMGSQPEARTWAHDRLFGIDRDSINVKLTRALMVAIGDGSAHVYIGDSIRTAKWDSEYPTMKLEAMNEESFTVLATNPPFGKQLRISASDARLGQYTICRHTPGGDDSENYASTEIGIVFVELAYRLLKKGGRLGIVLPETYFFSKSYTWFRKWLKERFILRGVMNIPMEAFQEFCRAKTNFYVLQKVGKPTVSVHVPKWFRNGECWVSFAPTIGINKDGYDLYVVDEDGNRGKEIDDRALADVVSMLEGRDTDTSGFVKMDGADYLGVPQYCNRSTEATIRRLVSQKLPRFKLERIGTLIEQGKVNVRIGHGSPSADVRNGGIPYIKVSDLRAGLVNVNSTNLVPYGVAQRMWHGDTSGLQPYSVITPSRASSNIGEPVMLLPQQVDVVITKEVLIFTVGEKADFDNFYLMWALDLQPVKDEWKRIIFMQTNREDVGDRYKDILIPVPANTEDGVAVSESYRSYYTNLAALKDSFNHERVTL